MLYCGESNVAPSKYSIMDNKNHFESKVSDFLEAMRKAGYSESTIRQYKKTCRLFIVYMDINYIQDCNVESINLFLTYIIHSGFISGYQNRYGDNLKPPTNVYHRMTA